MALAAACAMCIAALTNLYVVLEHGATRYALGGWPVGTSKGASPIGIEWVNDGLASVMLAALSFLASVCLTYGGHLLPSSLGGRVSLYYTLILLLISGVTGIVLAGDIFNVFVFLELAALSAYALVGVAGGKALVAAFRYVILGTLGASFYLLGVVFLYAVTGTLNMADLSGQLSSSRELLTSKAVIAGSSFIFIGLGIKMALFPLHGWLPGAYTLRGCGYAITRSSHDESGPVCLGPHHVRRTGNGRRNWSRAPAGISRRLGALAAVVGRAVGISSTGREANVCLRWNFARGSDLDWSEPGKSSRVCWRHVLHDR